MKQVFHQIVITRIENGDLHILGMNKDGTQVSEEMQESNDFMELFDEMLEQLTCPSQ